MATKIVTKQSFSESLQSSGKDLWQHALSGPGENEDPLVTARCCFRSAADLAGVGDVADGGKAQFELWWTNCPSQGLPVLLWDRWECRGLTRAEYGACLQELTDSPLSFDRVLDDAEWLGDVPPPRPLPTWKYHPERFKGTMPFAEPITLIGRQCKGNPTVDTLNQLVEAWQDADSHGFAARPLRARVHSPTRNSRRLFRIHDMLMFYAVFSANGRQIFDIPTKLGEMFRRTDVDDITAESIKVPYPGIYLHFGPQPDLAFEPGWTPEGAYVYDMQGSWDSERVLQFCVVSAPSSLEDYREFDINIEPVYTQSIGPKEMKMTLGEAVEIVLAEKLNELRKQVTEEPMAKLDDETKQLAAEHGVQLVSGQARLAAQELDAMAPQHKSYLEMLKLIVNSLAYLTAYPKDIETQWPANTPAHLLKDLSKTDNRNERQRIQSKLASQGFTPVHICGRRLAGELELQAAANSSGERHSAAHWRRGHWRRQPHGPQNALRKLVWLLPTLVNPGKAADEVPGHLYLVG